MMILGSLLWTTTGGGAPPPPPPVVEPPATRPSGGFPSREPGLRERRRAFFRRLGLPDEEAEIIQQVALRQVEDLRQDEAQRAEELLRELQLRDIEAEARHFEALAVLREQLIDIELGQLLRKQQRTDEEEAMLLILIAAYLT